MNGAVVAADPSDGGQRGGGRRRRGQGGQGGGQGRATGPRPYAEVITSAAKTAEGIFKVHRITEGNARSALLRDPEGRAQQGLPLEHAAEEDDDWRGLRRPAWSASRVVRWVLKGDKVLLENIDYALVADPSNPDLEEAEPAGDHPGVRRRGLQRRAAIR